MKKYKTDRILYMTAPSIISIVILIYMAFIYAKSDAWVNVFNLGIDVIILMYYFQKFCTGIALDDDKIYLTAFISRHTIEIRDVVKISSSSFLIKIALKKGSYYIIVSKKNWYILDEILSDIKKKMH